MSEKTEISWTDATFNPWMGCTKVSPACDHCYAERDTKRFGRVEWGAGKPRVRTGASNWKQPERWERQAESFVSCTGCAFRGVLDDWSAHQCPAGLSRGFRTARRRVFCASLADWLDNEAPIEWLVDQLDLIRRTPNLDWLLLTKRIGNWRARIVAALNLSSSVELREWLALWLNGDAPHNVWIMATVENQKRADEDIPKLLRVPAVVRGLSIEPMLGPIKLHDIEMPESGHGLHEFSPIITGNPLKRAHYAAAHVHWVIAGGESGPHARPMHPDWVRSLRDQCQAAGVAFHFKQWGEWAPVDSNMPSELQESDELAGKVVAGMHRIGKKAAGRALDGREWSEVPGP